MTTQLCLGTPKLTVFYGRVRTRRELRYDWPMLRVILAESQGAPCGLRFTQKILLAEVEQVDSKEFFINK